MTSDTPGDQEPSTDTAGLTPDDHSAPGSTREELPTHPSERPHLPSGRLSLGRLALEAVMIAFGVLLALSLESWHERRGDRALAREAIASIRVEMTRNAERIQRQIPEQRRVVEALNDYQEELAAGRRPPVPHMALHPPGLSSTAWKTAMSTQALAHMDFQTVRAMAGFYEMQPWIDRLEDTWLRLITQPRDNTPEADRQWAGSMENTLRSYIEIETALLAAVETAASRLPQEPARQTSPYAPGR